MVVVELMPLPLILSLEKALKRRQETYEYINGCMLQYPHPK